MSAPCPLCPPKADIKRGGSHVGLVPLADISAASSDWQASCGSALGVHRPHEIVRQICAPLVGLAIEADQTLW
jgi:hypothetical protein